MVLFDREEEIKKVKHRLDALKKVYLAEKQALLA